MDEREIKRYFNMDYGECRLGFINNLGEMNHKRLLMEQWGKRYEWKRMYEWDEFDPRKFQGTGIK